MALWAAAGVSLLPASLLGGGRGRLGARCEASPAPEADAEAGASLLARWAELGRIWREWSAAANVRYPPSDHDQLEQRKNELWKETDAALDALPAWPELRVLFNERALHIGGHEMTAPYVITCYVSVGPTYEGVGQAVFRQAKEVEKLAAEGKLTRRAAERASRRLAAQAEYRLRAEEAWEKANPPERYAEAEAADTDDIEALLDWREVNRVKEVYKAGRLRPSASAELAGRRVVELIADDLGMLAGEPSEDELPKPEPADEAEKEDAP